MSTLEEITEAAMALSEDDRLVLGERMLASVPPDPGYERAWQEEIKRRIDDLESGRTKGVPADEVFRKLRERFR